MCFNIENTNENNYYIEKTLGKKNYTKQNKEKARKCQIIYYNVRIKF